MKHEVKSVKVQNPVSEKDVYYIIIGEGEHRTVINTGLGNYNKIRRLNGEKDEAEQGIQTNTLEESIKQEIANEKANKMGNKTNTQSR